MSAISSGSLSSSISDVNVVYAVPLNRKKSSRNLAVVAAAQSTSAGKVLLYATVGRVAADNDHQGH